MNRPDTAPAQPEDGRRPEEGGTILEPIESLYAQYLQPAGQPAPLHPYQTISEPYRATAYEPPPSPLPPLPAGFPPLPPAEGIFTPTIRPAVPRVTILDDGDLAGGETVRLREQTTLIGRIEGAIRLPHDPLVSGRHAEIIRDGAAAPYRWVLRDLNSSNGTFVCCSGTALRSDRLIILGSKRFRFQLPAVAKATMESEEGTVMIDTRHPVHAAAPVLVETTNPDPSKRLEISLTKPSLTIGRPGFGNDVELDDPLIAAFHAQIVRTASGDWRIEAKPSKNGVWVQVSSIRLSGTCRFQCGEQRFLFVV